MAVISIYKRLRGVAPLIFLAFEEVARALAGLPRLDEMHRGDWASGTAYARGYLVTGSDGSSYVAIADSIGQDPTTTTGYWREFAAAGAAGASGSSATTRSQTVISGAVSSTTGCANFLSSSTGLTMDIAATTTAVCIAFSAGYDSSGAVNYIGRISADATSAWTGLTASTTNYLYVERNSSTGALTYGQSLYYPMYQAFAPTYHHRPASAGGTPYKVNGDANGAVALAFNGDPGTAYGSTATNATPVTANADVGYDFGSGVTRQVVAFTLRNYSSASNSVNSVKVQWSSDGAAWTDIQTSALSTTAGAIQTITVSSYTAARYFRLLANANTSAGPWYVPEVQFWHLPEDAHWFDTAAMKMYAYVSGSWTAKQRVFVGEAVTNATVVTSSVTYGLNGDYDSGWFYVDTSTLQYDKTHNLGLSMDEGLDGNVYWSRCGTSYDSSLIDGQSYAGVTRSGFTWNQTSASTTFQLNRLSAYLQIDNGAAWRATLDTVGFYRLRLRRNWG